MSVWTPKKKVGFKTRQISNKILRQQLSVVIRMIFNQSNFSVIQEIR